MTPLASRRARNIVLLVLCVGCEQQGELHSPTGYNDWTYEQLMDQSGVHIVQIPLHVRQEYARRHGLEVPWE